MSTATNENENERVLAALERLKVSLQELPDKQDPPHLSHWKTLPETIQAAYQYISQGAELCKATSTKYTLVGKMNEQEGAKLASELLRGCELIATGALVLCNDDQGCCRAARHYAKQAARAVVQTVYDLVQLFCNHQYNTTDNVAAMKTGAVWSTCDTLLKIPKGNRNSVRRVLFTYLRDCNETLEEFTAMMEQGPRPESTIHDNGGGAVLDTIAENGGSIESLDVQNDSSWNDFLQGTDDQYSTTELPIAVASLGLVKCSRGSINVTLKACESVGENVECNNNNTSGEDAQAWLDCIMRLVNLARNVGDGMTDLGTCLYPPLDLSSDSGNDVDNDVNGESNDDSSLQGQLVRQRIAIITLQDFVLDSCPTELPEEVTELASKLKAAATTRYDEAQAAVQVALENVEGAS